MVDLDREVRLDMILSLCLEDLKGFEAVVDLDAGIKLELV